MELRQLRYFVAVAEEGQVTRAAVRVSIAQPAVSAQIVRLEREVGEPLFHRRHRSVRLTDAGEAFLPYARAALLAAEQGLDAVQSLRGLVSGRLRIGVSGPAGNRFIQAVGSFHRSHPGVELSITEGQNEPLLQSLQTGEVDLAVVGRHGSLSGELRALDIASEPLVLAVRPEDPLYRRKTISLRQLQDQPMVSLTSASGLRKLVTEACRAEGFSPHIVADTSQLHSLVDLVAEGLGVAILPASALEGTNLSGLTISRPRLQRRTAVAWNPAAVSPAARAFLSLMD